MTRPRLILHIGSQKTGSTAIQSALDNHPESLAASGLRFARAGRKHIAHQRLYQAILSGRPRPAFLELRRELKAHPDATLILSCEMFLAPGIAPVFARFLGPDLCARTQVIAYLRRQDHFLEALYKQHLKNGRVTGTIQSYLKGRIDRLLYSPTLAQYDAAFGHKNLCVIPYERADFPDANGVADFAARIGWQDVPPEALGSGEVNASLSLPYCHALGARADLPAPTRRALIRALIADPTGHSTANNDVLSDRPRADILRLLARENTLIRDRWCPDRTALFAPMTPATTPPLPESALPEAIADAAAHIALLLEKIEPPPKPPARPLSS